MATLKPFRALRPDPKKAKDICAPPYDVLSSQEAREMAEGNPLSFLRVSKPEIELDPNVDPYSTEVYSHGARNLRGMIDDGHLIQDEKPCYYIYRITMGEHRQTGLVALASCEEYDRGIVKKHELTRPDKEDDRTRHINLLGAQTGNVFLSYRSVSSIDSVLADLSKGTPDYDFVADDGVRHEAWVISDDNDIREIEQSFLTVSTLYIADGHHRSAAASRVAKERQEANAHHTGEEPYNYFLTVTFPHNQVQILGYNRAVKDLNGHTAEELLKKIEEVADVREIPEARQPQKKDEVTFYMDGKWRSFTWLPTVLDHAQSAAATLDVAVLQKEILGPYLGIGDPRVDKRVKFVGGIRGTRELEKLVDSGEWAVAFSMFPTSMRELMAIADEGGLMPPKSTWFEPKLRDGLMVHLID